MTHAVCRRCGRRRKLSALGRPSYMAPTGHPTPWRCIDRGDCDKALAKKEALLTKSKSTGVPSKHGRTASPTRAAEDG